MAKDKAKEKDPKKAPGIFAQFGEGVRFLRENNPKGVPIAILSGVGVAITLGVFGAIISGMAFLSFTIWIILAIAAGYLAALLILSKLANSAVFVKYATEQGRTSLAVGTLTRRSYKGTQQPIAINPKSMDMVFRIVGPAGVVLMGEGAKTATTALLEDERRKVQRVAQGVAVHTLYCSENGDGIPLKQLHKNITKLKKTLNKAEVFAVQNRLSALDTRFGMPIPKGIDPNKMRPSRKMR
jgi:hypothetical protein